MYVKTYIKPKLKNKFQNKVQVKYKQIQIKHASQKIHSAQLIVKLFVREA